MRIKLSRKLKLLTKPAPTGHWSLPKGLPLPNRENVMSSLPLTLDCFIKSVPVGEPTTNLATALAMLQSESSETMVIVSQEKLPLGAIGYRSFVSHIIKRLQSALTEPSSAEKSLIRLQSYLTRTKLKSFMEPIAILPARMSVNEFWLSLQQDRHNFLGQSPYALVNSEGKFLGLLDSWSLLESLQETRQEEQTAIAKKMPFVLDELLFQFLEQMPLPVLTYASSGRILHRNLNWREQIGEFFPIDEGSFCPLVPESLPQNNLSQPNFLSGANESASQLFAAQVSRRQLLEALPEIELVSQEAHYPKIESLLTQPKTIGERAWQFVKFSLDTLGNRQERSLPGCEGCQTPLWLVIATDVTEHQRLCRELTAKNADLVQLNRLKDEFLACISHELKSPLTAVMGLSSLLKEQKLGELNQRQVRYAQLIYQSGRQLMSLVNDLLDLTSLETGQLKLHFAPVRIQTICEQAYAVVEEKYQRKTETAISFSLEIEPDLETIVADELRVRQILVHLLDNAVKFTPAGKPIGLKVNRWENWLAFTVWDTGIGIPEKYQHLIFQKFQQLESPLTRQFEGTGLGLFLTQRLAKAHGGDISFISKVGQGCQFTLLLPLSPDSSSNGEPQEKQQRHPLVLVVEADPRAIENLTEKLTAFEYRVAIARTGTEALEKARQLQPHAIFLNPSLPLLSGWDVLTLLKSDRQTKQIRVIITQSKEASSWYGESTAVLGSQSLAGSSQVEQVANPKDEVSAIATPADNLKKQRNGASGFLSLPVDEKALQVILSELSEPPSSRLKRLTILRLYPDPQKSSLGGSLGMNSPIDLTLIAQLSQLNHRFLEADDLEQAEMLARVWKIDAVVLDGTVAEEPPNYLRSLGQCHSLSTLPLITLDAQTTELANKIGNLSVFPCLAFSDRHSFDYLLQVIQIAAASNEGSEQ